MLLEVNTSSVMYICFDCGMERDIPFNKLLTRPEIDPAIFFVEACPGCGASETFVWSNWVYELPEIIVETVIVEVEDEKGNKTPKETNIISKGPRVPRPDHPQAEHMALIETVAKKLKCKQANFSTLPEQAGKKYPTKPQHPDPNKLRNVTAVQLMQAGHQVLPPFLP